jgi:uncharacterized membrane-anchored protein
MMSQLLRIMVCYAETVVVTHGVTDSAKHTMIHHYWNSIAQHDSQPLAQHYTS